MHVSQLLNPFLFGTDVEVVKALLPDPITQRFAFAQQSTEALFHNFHNHGWVAHRGHGHQQMNVFRHDDISQKHETVSPPRLFENAKEQVASRWGSQLRLSPITTEGDEVQRIFEIIPLETCRHSVRLCDCMR